MFAPVCIKETGAAKLGRKTQQGNGAHTSLSVDRRLGSDSGFRSINKLVALILMCPIVPPRSRISSRKSGSRLP